MTARVAVTPQVLRDAGFLPITVTNTKITWVVADVSNKNKVAVSDGGVLLFYNTDGTNPYTYTITPRANEAGRSGDVGPHTLAAGDIAAIWIPPSRLQVADGSADDGSLQFEVNNVAVKVAFLQLPITALRR